MEVTLKAQLHTSIKDLYIFFIYQAMGRTMVSDTPIPKIAMSL